MAAISCRALLTGPFKPVYTTQVVEPVGNIRCDYCPFLRLQRGTMILQHFALRLFHRCFESAGCRVELCLMAFLVPIPEDSQRSLYLLADDLGFRSHLGELLADNGPTRVPI